MSAILPDRRSEYMPERMSDRMSDCMSDKMTVGGNLVFGEFHQTSKQNGSLGKHFGIHSTNAKFRTYTYIYVCVCICNDPGNHQSKISKLGSQDGSTVFSLMIFKTFSAK